MRHRPSGTIEYNASAASNYASVDAGQCDHNMGHNFAVYYLLLLILRKDMFQGLAHMLVQLRGDALDDV